ncbi:MAG: hypothetical protein ACR2HF_09410 [Methylococcaceae bacterium]
MLDTHQAPAHHHISPHHAQQYPMATISSSLTLATKQDIARVELKMVEHDGEFKLIKWMLGIVLGGILSLIMKAYF